jgi:hypothetical protein
MKNRSISGRGNWASLIVVVAIVLALAMLAVPSVMAQSDGPKVFKPDSVAYGRTYSEWSAAWWQWAMSVPVASHPLFDNGDCSIGQSGPVWFLGGKFCQTGGTCSSTVTRFCSVPAGKAILFPILNVEDSAPEEPAFGCGNSFPPLIEGTIAEMRKCTEFYQNMTTALEADIDGRPIHNLMSQFREQSVVFEITIPSDNLLNAIGEGPFPAGTYSPVVDEGFYVLLQPLSPGSHILHFQGSQSNGFSENITYNLTVAK